ncbi:MAG: outer membrane beta-barrel protein [Pseudomonadota bacterium]
MMLVRFLAVLSAFHVADWHSVPAWGQAATAYQNTTTFQPRYAYQSTWMFQPTTVWHPADIYKSLTVYKTFPVDWPNAGHPVNERPRAEFVPLGVPVSTWFLVPSVSAGTYFDSNLFSAPNNERWDIRTEIQPRLALHSALPGHALNIQLGQDERRHLRTPEADFVDRFVRGEGRFDIDHATALYLTGAVGVFHDDLGERVLKGTVDPIRYTVNSIQLSANHEANRLALTGNISWRSFDFQDAFTLESKWLDQDTRDVEILFGGLRGSYDIATGRRAYTSLELEKRFPLIDQPKTSVSWGLRGVVGAEFDIDKLVRLRLGVGYMMQDFARHTLADVHKIAGQANLVWMPTDLTTWQLMAYRSIDDAPLSNASARVPTTVGLRLDHEFTRYLIGTGFASYTHIEDIGVHSVDHHYDISGQVRYFLNRHADVTAQYRYGYRLLNHAADVRRHIAGLNVSLKY